MEGEDIDNISTGDIHIAVCQTGVPGVWRDMDSIPNDLSRWCTPFSLSDSTSTTFKLPCYYCNVTSGEEPGFGPGEYDINEPWILAETGLNKSQAPQCCGDDSGEFERNNSCLPGACNPGYTQSNIFVCCDKATDCVSNASSAFPKCYDEFTVMDADGFGGNERCVNGRWADNTVPTCNIEWINVDSGSGYVSGTNKMWYNPSAIGSFTVNASYSDSGPLVSPLNTTTFPYTTSAGTTFYFGAGEEGSANRSWQYNWNTGSTESSNFSVLVNDSHNNIGNCTFEVILDNQGASGGSVSYTNGYVTSSTLTITLNNGVDNPGGSGLAYVQLQRKQAVLSGGSCGAYGAWSDVGSQTLGQTSYDDAVSTATCYKYQYQVTD
ncbi:hypothetical protein D6745_05335, partial [Candidatus Woesearchaeota archaeon]